MMPSGATLGDFYGNCVPAPGQLFSASEAEAMSNAAAEEQKP
jgi:hypothetical protein